MQPHPRQRKGNSARQYLPWLVALSCFIAKDAPARVFATTRQGADTPLAAEPRPPRAAAWAGALEPLEIASMSTKAQADVRLYDPEGDVDERARVTFERIASREPDAHSLAVRLEQIVVKAAYHFGVKRVLIVSGWRERAGKHGTGEALDFKLPGVSARAIAAYLRGLPRVGVGLYTHPGTEFVHVDVREPSYHWVDASPPGVHWKERQLFDPHGAERDATYEPDFDLPI